MLEGNFSEGGGGHIFISVGLNHFLFKLKKHEKNPNYNGYSVSYIFDAEALLAGIKCNKIYQMEWNFTGVSVC